jgi:hypothetical protein
MIDIDMLELIGRPGCGAYSGTKPPPMLEEVFARVVADGWHPRVPCTDERELARLEQSTVRGDCISPLLQAGDTIFIDAHMPAQSGDVVSFSLSRRGAEAQNSDLPPGQSPWRAGDRWCKLLVRHHFDMLLDRHGNSATATLMSCEHPDDIPVLHPVRNIRRNGQLLFTPDAHSSQLGLNAATDVYSGSLVGPTTSGTQTGVFLTVAVPSVAYSHTAIVTMTGDFWRSNAGGIWMERDLHGSTTGGIASEERFLVSTATPGERVTIQYEFSNLGGTAYDYNLQFDTTSPSYTITAENVRVQVEIIKR